MNAIAREMNEVISKNSPVLFSTLSDFGKRIFMPKGIIVQSAEAKQHAKKYNATIGIAKENNGPMFLPSLKKYFNDMNSSEIFDYAPGFGNQELRTKWKNKIVKENPSIKSIDNISTPVVTCGLTHGITLAADLFVDENDEIIIPDKLWENYNLILEERYGAKVVNYSLFDESLKGFNSKALDNAISSSKKEKIILLFNFPNNPTGYTPTKKEADEIYNIVTKHAKNGKKIVAICDDAYYGLLYENELLEGSIFERFVGAHENITAIKLDGVSKEDYSWGLRVGFMTFGLSSPNSEVYKVLESKVAAAIRCSISNCSQVAQSVFAKTIGDDDYVDEKKQKYEILKERARKTKEVVYLPKYKDFWEVYPFNSGYFMCLKLKGVDAEELRQYALKQYGVGTIVLGDDLRVAFSSVEIGDIEDLFETIAKCVKELRK